MFAAIVLLAVVLVLFWILRPAYTRWRDYLQHAPELQDAPLRTKLLVLFQGLRTRMLARLMDGLGIALPAVNAIGEMVGAGAVDLNALLPAIPLVGHAADGSELMLAPSQYAPIVFLLFGRLVAYCRSLTTTPVDTINPAVAIEAAAESRKVEGSVPSTPLAAIVDPNAKLIAVPAAAPAPAKPKPRARRRRRKAA